MHFKNKEEKRKRKRIEKKRRMERERGRRRRRRRDLSCQKKNGTSVNQAQILDKALGKRGGHNDLLNGEWQLKLRSRAKGRSPCH